MKQPCNAHAYEQEEQIKIKNVTRLEVIDHTGRAYVIWNSSIELSYQDEGRTLKIFVTPNKI